MRKFAVGLALLVGFAALHGAYDVPPARRARAQSFVGVVPLGAVWNESAPVISTGIFAASVASGGLGHALTPSQDGSVLRISVALANTGPLYVLENNGTTTKTIALNGGSSLTSFQAYTFVWGMRRFDPAGNVLTYDLVMGAASTGSVPAARCDEVVGGVD